MSEHQHDHGLTYYEWLGKQSDEFKRAAIRGDDNASEFASGSMSKAKFDRLKIGKRFAPIDLEGLKGIDGLSIG